MKPDDQTLFLTGATGQIGREIRRQFADWELTAPTRGDLDLRDPRAISTAVSDLKPVLIVHCAAATGVDACESNSLYAEQVNAQATQILAGSARQVGAAFVYLSTDYVFDGTLGRPYQEDDVTRPLSVYGRTKWHGEIAAATCDKHLVVRTSWVYGDGRNFVRTIIDLARRRQSLRVVNDQFGRPTYAKDVAIAIRALVDARASSGIYHFQNTGPVASWADVADEALKLAGMNCVVDRITTDQFIRERPGVLVAPRPAYSVLNLKKVSGFLRPRDWRRALADYVTTLG